MNASELLLAARDLFLFGEKKWGHGALARNAAGNIFKDLEKRERVSYGEAVSVCALGALGCLAEAPVTYDVFEPDYAGFSELREAVGFLAQAFGRSGGGEGAVSSRNDDLHKATNGDVSVIVGKFDEAAKLAKEEGR